MVKSGDSALSPVSVSICQCQDLYAACMCCLLECTTHGPSGTCHGYVCWSELWAFSIYVLCYKHTSYIILFSAYNQLSLQLSSCSHAAEGAIFLELRKCSCMVMLNLHITLQIIELSTTFCINCYSEVCRRHQTPS